MTPLPDASPSALMTIGVPCSTTYALAASGFVNTAALGVGMPASSINSFAQDLLDSIWAPAWVGPKTMSFFCWK